MPSLRSRLCRLPVKYAIRPSLSPRWSIATQRRLLRLLSSPMRLPAGTRVEPVNDGLSGEWIMHEQADSRRALLYLHGGAYVIGSPGTHRTLAAHLSRQANAHVFVLAYRLAPEHPYPAAVEDAVAACRRLFRDFDPEHVLLAGDSAGGGLAMATLMALRDAGHPLPRRACCLSPWVDLELQGESMTERAWADPLLTSDWLRVSARLYAGTANPGEPRISPLHGELKQLPPLLIQVGSDEILLSDAHRLAQRARSAGVKVTLDVWEGMWHNWHMLAGYMPESAQALAEAGQFLQG